MEDSTQQLRSRRGWARNLKIFATLLLVVTATTWGGCEVYNHSAHFYARVVRNDGSPVARQTVSIQYVVPDLVSMLPIPWNSHAGRIVHRIAECDQQGNFDICLRPDAYLCMWLTDGEMPLTGTAMNVTFRPSGPEQRYTLTVLGENRSRWSRFEVAPPK